MLSNIANEAPNAYRIVEVTIRSIGPASYIPGEACLVEHEVQCQTEGGWARVHTCETLAEARRWLIAHMPHCNCWLA